MTAEVARSAGPIAAAGLALLFFAPRRELRLAGLVAWAAGCIWLAYYLAPRGHLPLLAGGAVVALVLAAVGAALLRRWPWLLALAALACVPARIQVGIGSTQASLLVPMYGVVAAAALALGWQLFRRDERSRELGPLALPLGAFVLWSGLTLMAVSCIGITWFESVVGSAVLLFGLGLGWSLSFVAATAQLADRAAPAERGKLLGFSDQISALAGAALALLGGYALDSLGVAALAIGATVLVLLPLLRLLRRDDAVGTIAPRRT